MLEWITFGLVVVILLENSPTRKAAAVSLFNKFKRTTRGLFG